MFDTITQNFTDSFNLPSEFEITSFGLEVDFL